MQNKKNVSIRALPEWGGGLPLPEFFCALFFKEKVSSMVATAERVGKVARIGGWGGFFLANSGNARIETFFLVLMSSLSGKVSGKGHVGQKCHRSVTRMSPGLACVEPLMP